MKKIIMINLFLVSFVLGQVGSNGQYNAKLSSMANSGTSSVYGLNALGLNPANLSLEKDESVEISTLLPLPNVDISFGNKALSIDDINYYFSPTDSVDENGDKVGKYLSASDVTNLKNLLKDGFFNFNTNVKIFSISYHNSKLGSVAFSINDIASARGSIPQNLVELIDGTESNYKYDFNDLELKAWYLRSYALTYSKELKLFNRNKVKNFSFGISLKYIQGFSYSEANRIDSYVKIIDDKRTEFKNILSARTSFSPDFGVKYDFENGDESSNASFFNEPAGTGLGIDLGVNLQLNDIFSFGLSFTDIGSIKWEKETAEFKSDASFSISNFTNSDLVDSLFKTLEPEAERIGSFTTDLPTALHIGTSINIKKLFANSFYKDLIVSVDIHQGFNEMPGNKKGTIVSFGTYFKPLSWLETNTGIAIGGYNDFNWAFGLGFDLGAVKLDICSYTFSSIVSPNSSKNINLSFGSVLKF